MLCTYKHGFEMAHISITTTGCTRESINKAMDSINFHKVTTFESKKKKVEVKMLWQFPTMKL